MVVFGNQQQSNSNRLQRYPLTHGFILDSKGIEMTQLGAYSIRQLSRVWLVLKVTPSRYKKIRHDHVSYLDQKEFDLAVQT